MRTCVMTEKQQKKILIVDDDVNMRRAIRRVLTLGKNYLFAEAGDGAEAEKSIPEFAPHLVILDVRMPRKGGYEVLFDLRANKHNRKMKIIGISGEAGKIGDAIMGSLGADHFFEKPFDDQKLRRKVAELLGETLHG